MIFYSPVFSTSGGSPVGIEGLTDQLARRLKDQRTRLNLSQDEAADQLGVSRRAFSDWEHGKTFPQPRHRRKLVEFFNRTPEW